MSSKDSSSAKRRKAAELLRLVAEDRAESGRRPPPPSGHPALALLLLGRWDDAFGVLHQLSEQHLGDERAQRLLDVCGDRAAVQDEIRETVDALYARGTPETGELALAWSMLTCMPSYTPSFRAVLPQLQYALDAADLDANDDGDVRDRLRVWWAAGRGDHTNETRSMFAVAVAVLAGEIMKESALEPVPAFEPVDVARFFMTPYPGPTKVVMRAAKAAKLAAHTKHFEAILDKPLPLVIGRDLANAQRRLGYEFPHATAALSALFKDLREGEPVKVRPTILLGPSGSGKSRFVRKFAMAVGLRHIQMVDAASSGDNHFGGTSRSWSTSEPSVPARAVLASLTANPLVLIEEIDKAKAGVSSVNGSLYNALALYLEPESASRVRDPSLDAEVDLASVSYICTANAAELPDFLRDRFRIVKLPAPRLIDLPLLAASIMEDMAREDDERAGDEPLAPDELMVIAKAWEKAGFSMRKLQKIVLATLQARDAYAMRH